MYLEEPGHTNLSGIRNVLVRTPPAPKAPVKYSACRLALPVALWRPPSVLPALIGINDAQPEQCGACRKLASHQSVSTGTGLDALESGYLGGVELESGVAVNQLDSRPLPIR